MQHYVLTLFIALSACAESSVPDFRQLAVAPDAGGAVEVIVKTNHPTLLAEISAGGGPTLTRAMDAAGIPAEDRPARIVSLQSDFAVYQGSPGALTSALRLWGQ